MSDYPNSYYVATAEQIPASACPGDCEVDVAVVGGGFAGLTAAHELAHAGVDVALLEAQRLGWGASGRNGGQLFPHFGTDAAAMLREHDPDAVRLLFRIGEESAEFAHALIGEHRIECDLKRGTLR